MHDGGGRACGIGVHLVPLGGGQVVGSLQEAGTKGDGLGMGLSGVLDVKVEVNLLCVPLGPLGRTVVGCELYADHPSPVGVEHDNASDDLHLHIIAPRVAAPASDRH